MRLGEVLKQFGLIQNKKLPVKRCPDSNPYTEFHDYVLKMFTTNGVK